MIMVSNITDERRKELEFIMSKAEPYSDDELDQLEYDAPVDIDRIKATRAKMILEGKI